MQSSKKYQYFLQTTNKETIQKAKQYHFCDSPILLFVQLLFYSNGETKIQSKVTLGCPCTQVPDAGSLLDLYGNRGLDFIVDVGTRTVQPTSVSVRRC